jgi:hypothetical protein
VGQRRNNSYKILVDKLNVEGRFGKPRCKWKDNIQMDLKETEYEDSSGSG